MRFSERHGYKKVREIIQIDSMDDALRTTLWNLLQIYIWDSVVYAGDLYRRQYLSPKTNKSVYFLCQNLWINYFKRPLDGLGDDWKNVYPILRDHFFKCSWYEVYDFIEFIVNNHDQRDFAKIFIPPCNRMLEQEMSAYRFVGNTISRITEEHEITEIEQAVDRAQGPVRTHLHRALELLSSRESPDYRNSIKESISAVESLVASALGKKGTLGQLIKKLEEEIGLHSALKNAFSSLYGYTSDEGGIRHALLESETVKFEDAKFYLVVCSAFMNFVEAKLVAKA